MGTQKINFFPRKFKSKLLFGIALGDTTLMTQRKNRTLNRQAAYKLSVNLRVDLELQTIFLGSFHMKGSKIYYNSETDVK